MKYFITGGTGFIGMELTRRLAAEGHDIHLLVRSTAKAAKLNMPGVSLFEGNLTDAATIEQAMAGCTHVFHLAAYAKPVDKHPAIFHRINVEGTRFVLEAALKLGVQRVVFTSTAGTLGVTGPDNDATEDSDKPGSYHTHYETTKRLAEKVCDEYIDKGLDIVTVYPSRVYGPGVINESNAMTTIISQYMKGKWRIIPGNGKTYGNYVFIDDVVNGLVLAMQKGRNGGSYILGGHNVTFLELFRTMKKATKKNYLLLRIPYPVLWFAALMMVVFSWFRSRPAMISPGWVSRYLQHRRLSGTRSAEELGYTTTPLLEGFEKTANWLREREKAVKQDAATRIAGKSQKKDNNKATSTTNEMPGTFSENGNPPLQGGTSTVKDMYYTLITGSSSGIGRALAAECARRRMNLFLVSLPGTGLPDLAEQMQRTYGVACAFFETDLMQEDAFQGVYDYAMTNKLKVNILINNVGVGYNGQFESMPPHKISRMFSLNVLATTMLTQIFLPELKKHPGAHILNMGSLGAFTPIPGKSVYAASKAYVLYLTKALRAELKHSNIKVSGIFPAGVPTNPDIQRRIALGGNFARSLIHTPEVVARCGIEGMLRGRELIFPGKKLKPFFFTASIIPQGIVMRLLAREFKRAPDQ